MRQLHIAGLNLYRVHYVCPPLEITFQVLVVADSEREAREMVPRNTNVILVENDISLTFKKFIVASQW